jgi:hypothetical protein
VSSSPRFILVASKRVFCRRRTLRGVGPGLPGGTVSAPA